jgi:hypothetical protein
MSSRRLIASLSLLGAVAAIAVVSAGTLWVGAQAWLWLGLIGGLSAAAGLTLGRPPVPLTTLPASSAELVSWLARELGAGLSPERAPLFESFRALAHALYGEHDQAALAVKRTRWDDTPAVQAIRAQTLAVLAYISGDAEQGLAHASEAQRIVHSVAQQPERAEQLAHFYVAWGQVLTARFHGDLTVFERFCADSNPVVATMARAALARGAEVLGRDREALDARVQLAELAPAAYGIRDHADPSPGIRSGVRRSASASELPRAKRPAARR